MTISQAKSIPRAQSVAALLIVVMLGVPCAAQQATSLLPEIRADVAAENYRDALTKINKQLFPSAKDQSPAERYEILMLKGECQLQLMDRIGASSAFKSATKLAANVNELAAARANALIIDRSTSGRYSPRFGAPDSETIDILPPAMRKKAMIAYSAELQSQNKSKIEAAMSADKLPPIEQVFPKVADMYALELCATGESKDAGKLMQDLGSRAFALMQGEASKLSSRVDYLTQLANSAGGTGRGWNVGRAGLTSQQRDEVKAMLPYLNQIRDRASEYRRIASRAGGNEGKWEALVADVVETISEAESLYNDR